jgi:hypothetical protein
MIRVLKILDIMVFRLTLEIIGIHWNFCTLLSYDSFTQKFGYHGVSS